LLEYVVKVRQRSKSVAGAFGYTYTDLKGRYLFTKVLRKDQNVFRAYKSFRQDEHNKPKNALVRWVVVVVGFVLCGGFLFNSALASLKDRSAKSAAVAQMKQVEPEVLGASSSGSLAGLSAPVLEISPVVDGVGWRQYQVEGAVEHGGGYTFIINGRRIGGARTRNYDKELGLVEFYGLPIPAQAGHRTAAPESLGGPATSSPGGGALAPPSAPPVSGGA
jgi:hypothetical protein